MTRRLAPVAFAGIVLLLAGVVSSARADEISTIQQIYVNGMQGGSGGAYGFYVKQVGGPVILNHNETLVYDPASALKTLYLAYAFREIAAGRDALVNQVPVYAYPNSRNAPGNPLSPNLCPNPADETPQNAVNNSLDFVLRQMMTISDNRATRALELRYGRANLNALAGALGMGDTRLDQIIGCGYDGGRRNSWTLVDAGRLYEGISSGTAVPSGLRDALYASMIRTRGPSAVVTAVQQEAAALGISDAVAQFGAGITVLQKGGSYDICTISCSVDYQVTRDTAGILTIPFRNPGGSSAPIDFAWGSYITGLRIPCPPRCDLAAQARTAAVEVAPPALFRLPIRNALQSWAALTELTAERGKFTSSGLRVAAHLRTSYGGKRPAGQTIEFRSRGTALCTAVTDTSGTATCVAPSRSRPVGDYEARFAGSAGLFAASARASVAPSLAKLWLKVRGKGNVRVSGAARTCTSVCSYMRPVGAPVTLTASAASGWRFAGWRGGECHGRKAARCKQRASGLTVQAVFVRVSR